MEHSFEHFSVTYIQICISFALEIFLNNFSFTKYRKISTDTNNATQVQCVLVFIEPNPIIIRLILTGNSISLIFAFVFHVSFQSSFSVLSFSFISSSSHHLHNDDCIIGSLNRWIVRLLNRFDFCIIIWYARFPFMEKTSFLSSKQQ